MVASGIWEEVITRAHRLSHWISGLRCRWIASFVSAVSSFVLTARLKPETAAGEGHEAGGLRKDGIREIFGAFDETETWGLCCFILFVVMRQSFMHKSKARLVWTYHFADCNFHPTVCRNKFWSEQPWSFHQLHLMSQDSELFWVKAPFVTMFAASVLLCSSMSIFFDWISRSFFVWQMP